MTGAKKDAGQYARSLIEASLNPQVTISVEGQITDFNKATAGITSKTREALTSTDFFEYFTNPKKAREVYREVFAKGFVVDYPLTIRNRKATPVLFNGSLYKDESEKVLGAGVVARDITKVLVVEDIALNQLLMKTLLDDFGFERDIAENGKVAIEKLQTNTYDIILMNLQMPEMNGFEATEYIRKTLKLDIPIIGLTADVTTVDFAKCKAVGLNDYIAKPVDERVLYSKIIGLIRKPEPNLLVQNDEKQSKKHIKCIDLDYLIHRTKNNSEMIIQMISAYLEQTPSLISAIKSGILKKDWDAISAAAYKMIPSFSIMGIGADFENMAKEIQRYASNQKQSEDLHVLVAKLEKVCTQACKELEEELHKIKTAAL